MLWIPDKAIQFKKMNFQKYTKNEEQIADENHILRYQVQGQLRI